MIAMIFEFWLNEAHIGAYSKHSAHMRELVDTIDGFISVERYRSEFDSNKILALGFFRDEEAVSAWRNHVDHQRAQDLGRQRYYTDYRLRMAEVVRDYGLHQREQAPSQQHTS